MHGVSISNRTELIMKLWQKGTEPDKEVEQFTVGEDYILDQQLVKYDCLASMAHARMLNKINIISVQECDRLIAVLQEIVDLDAQGKFKIKQSDEDCHTAIENYLTKKLGETGKKIHTGRSRNDQVLTALRLFYRDAIDEIMSQLSNLSEAFSKLKQNFGSIPLPGFTHTRKAMPSSVEMWSQAFIDAIADDQILIKTIRIIVNQSPLGTAAGYGVPLPLDREFTAKELGFDKVQQNPVYTQMSRGKFETMILHALSQVLYDLNRCATDMIFLSIPEWDIFKLPDSYCTGSSIMPQKMNPDILELIRSDYHVINGYQVLVQNINANLITGYHRDIQNSKGPVLKAFKITNDSISILSSLIGNTKINADKAKAQMTEELYATEKAYKLVKQGIPFREAYRQVAKEIFKK